MQSSKRTILESTPLFSAAGNHLVIPVDELRVLVTNSSLISEAIFAASTQWHHFRPALDNARQLVETTHLLSDFKLWHQIFSNAEGCSYVKKVSHAASVPTFVNGLNDEWRQLRESYATLISHRSEAYEEHPEIKMTYQLFAEAVNYHKQLVYKPFRKDKIGDVGTDQIIAEHVKVLDRINGKRRLASCCSCFGLFGKKVKIKDRLNDEASHLFIGRRCASSSEGR